MRKILTFFIAIIAPFFVIAQTPGGISIDLSVWYRADNGVVTDGSKLVTQWNSSSFTNVSLTPSGTATLPYNDQTTYKKTLNFNPTVTFDGTNNYLRNTTTNYLTSIGSVHYIVVARGTNRNTNYQSLFAIAGNDDGFFYSGGGTTAFPAIGNNFNSAAAAISSPNDFGIYSAILPKTPAQGTQRGFYNGLKKNYTSPYPIGGGSYALPSAGAYIGADGATGDNFTGDIAEVILYHSPLGNDLSDADLEKIHSYLAVKYGITLTSTQNYLSSTNQVVWNATANSGFGNNIAGLGRDTALNQRQSMSSNPGKQILISTTGLTSTNTGNSTQLTDGQYLIWGDNGLAKMSTVPISGVSGVNYRFASVWKAQNTGNVGTVRVAWPANLKNLKLVQSSDTIFDGTDTVTDMSANTQTVNGVTYNYADVTLADGQYFTLASYVQAPGGVVNGLTQWYRADSKTVNTGDGTDVTSWTDQISSTVSAQISTAALPKYKAGAKDYFNFNPGLNFTAIQQMIGNISESTLNNVNYDIFTLTKEGMTGTRFFNIGMNNTTLNGANWDQPGLYADGNIGFRNNAGSGTVYFANPGSITFNANIPSIMYHTFTDTSLSKGLNGAANGTTATHSAIGLVTGGHIFGANGGVNPPNGDDFGFVGNLGEVAIYGGGNITPTERRRVDSYLAIKYGITLSRTSTDNYLSASGGLIWDGTANSAYSNNIAGIAKDELAALDQKQSISVNAGKQVIISTTGFAINNQANTTSLNDGQYVLWGDNGLQKTPKVAILGISGINYRFESIWKVQNTGNAGTVRVTWPTGLTNLKLVQSNDANFDGSDVVTDMSANTQTVNGITYNYADVTLSNGQYFTFAAFVQAPGGVVGDLRVWLKPDNGFTPAVWQDKSINANDFTQTNATRQPFIATTLYNFNPVVDFGGTASADGRFMVYPSGGPFTANGLSATLFSTTLTRTGGTSGYRDIWGFGGTTTTASLVNANSPTVTKLNNDIVLYDSTTSAFSGQYPDNQFLLTDMSYTVNVAGIKYGLNGTTANTTQTRVTGNSLQASGSVLGSQPEVMNGVMGDMIAYERDLTTDEKIKVRTYSSVKYGITLPHDYVSSSNQIVWDNTSSTSYGNNIFGIANDLISSLYQKQSKSINDGQKLIIGAGGALANTNASNTNSLTDGQFLIVGDNGLKQNLAVPINGITGVNYRFESIWKAQNTGSVGTVRVAWPVGLTALTLIQSSDSIFDGTDTVTDMTANTQVVNGVTYNYADVTLSNGQYFTFAAFSHAPGGVINGLSHWYRADIDATNTGNGTDVTAWKDYTSGVVSAQINAKALPKYRVGDASYFNFNPGISFTAVTQTIGNISLPTLQSRNNDVFTFTKEGMTFPGSPNPHFFSIGMDNTTNNDQNWDYLGLFPNATIERRVVGGGTQLPSSGVNFSTTIPSIMYNTFSNTTLARGLNGAANAATVSTAAVGDAVGGHIFGDTRWTGNGSDNGGIIGDLGETIIYGAGNITPAERRKVDSYLALKYGITLGRTDTDHYLSSTNSMVWDGAFNTAFNNNIFGLAKDDISSLHQKVSKSVNAGTILIMATNNDFVSQNLAGTRTALSGDQKFFVAGDNNITATPLNTVVFLAGNNTKVIQRKWLVQRTADLGNLYFQADLTAYESQFYASGLVYMVVADDANFTTNRILIPGTKVAGKWEFNHNFDSENVKRYITFATFENAINAACYKPGAIASAGNPALISKMGISSLARTSAQSISDNWPAARTGAWLVLEAKTKGFVINRMAFNASGNPVGITPANFVEGMLVYDITNKCLKMYTSQDGGTTFGWYCMTTQACPD
ncbi:beta strand repeat-containing protein [Chryseobacterium sp. MMS23-Vi53]|uniref:beta strand repeat-containing protein n=1 Tax=Chryseobacterium sp. MMS23-Vi53 TaxID=3386644 RepID=UPI0039E7C8DB